MKKKDLLEGKDYIVISTHSIYPGFLGNVKWILVSDLSESELYSKYGKELDTYESWVFITLEQYAVMVDWKRNEEKHRRHIYGVGKSGAELYYGVDGSFMDKQMERSNENSYSCGIALPVGILFGEFAFLTPLQRERLEKRFNNNMSISEIAKEENVSFRAVKKSIEQGLNKLRTEYSLSE